MHEVKKVLKTLNNEFVLMDNAKERIEDLNKIIRLINSVEEMLTKKYKTDVLDVFILNFIFRTLLLEKKTTNNKTFIQSGKRINVNINEALENITSDIKNGKEYQLEQLIGYLQQKEIENNILLNKVKASSKNEWRKTINKTLIDIKRKIIWYEKFK